jgi:hypothetical protein
VLSEWTVSDIFSATDSIPKHDCSSRKAWPEIAPFPADFREVEGSRRDFLPVNVGQSSD